MGTPEKGEIVEDNLVATQAHESTAAAASEPKQAQEGSFPAPDADVEDLEAQGKLLKDIEDQCVSHGRHPGEWDNLKLNWVDSVRPRSPQMLCITLHVPVRCV